MGEKLLKVYAFCCMSQLPGFDRFLRIFNNDGFAEHTHAAVLEEERCVPGS
jgi:hypothetical protein